MTCAFLVGSAALVACFGLEDELSTVKRRAELELPPALAQIEEIYSHMFVSGTLTENRRSRRSPPGSGAQKQPTQSAGAIGQSRDSERTSVYRFRFYANGELRKYEYERQSAPGGPQEGPGKGAEKPGSGAAGAAKSVACVGRTYSFCLRGKDERGALVVTSFGKSTDKEINELIMLYMDCFTKAPYAFTLSGPGLREMMADPGFSITGVSRLPGAPAGRVQIDFEFDVVGYRRRIGRVTTAPGKSGGKLKSVGKLKGWVVVSAQGPWVIHEFGLGQRSGRLGSFALEIQYGERRAPNGAPVVTRVTRSAGVIGERLVFDVDQIDFKPIPESEFTLSAYGLPELDRPAPRAGENRQAVFMFAAALLSLAASAGLLWWSRRLRPSTEPASGGHRAQDIAASRAALVTTGGGSSARPAHDNAAGPPFSDPGF